MSLSAIFAIGLIPTIFRSELSGRFFMPFSINSFMIGAIVSRLTLSSVFLISKLFFCKSVSLILKRNRLSLKKKAKHVMQNVSIFYK